MQRSLTLLVFVLGLFSNLVCFAQTGKIAGILKFEDGAPVAYATVVIKSLNKHSLSATDGSYEIAGITYGNYQVEISSLEIEKKVLNIEINKASVNFPIVLKRAESSELEEVVVEGKTIKREIVETGFTVNVIEPKTVELQSIQTNELLDRSAGVRVRQSGGLGSVANYNLNGLSGNSVKIFIDGVPIRNFGPSFSLNSIPPALIQRIEIYKGVVPAHLSDDAMGGAINIILKNSIGNKLTASYSFGSFNTHQADINGNYRSDKSGFTVRGSGFFNYSDNNYKVWGDQVAVQLAPGVPDTYITARRFHDTYHSKGFKGEAGFTNVKWADKLMAGVLFSDMYKEIQNGATMEIVYGNRFSEQQTKMFSLDYAKKDIIKGLDVSTFASFSQLDRITVDTNATQYSWLGYPTNYYNKPDVWASGAEAGVPSLQADIDRNLNSRSNITYRINTQNTFQVNHLLNTFSRDTDDPLLPKAEREMIETREYIKNILAASYENTTFKNRLKTTLFMKSYHMNRISNIRHRPNRTSTEITLNKAKVNSDDLGFGGAMSFRLSRKLMLIGSAEKAIRLPEANEVYGNVANNINPTVDLRPEKSNNYNLGFDVENIRWRNHSIGFRGNVFIRDTKDLIMQLPVGNQEEFFKNSNVGKTFTKGFDAELSYIFNKAIFFTANTSVFDARDYNPSYDLYGKPIAPTYERLPNTPYFTMSYNLRWDKKDLFQTGSIFSVYYNVLYVHEFFRQGNGLGGAGKTVIPSQFSNDTGVAYTFPNKKLTASLDAKNIFDQQIFDNYALQKPGRAFYIKCTYSIF